MFSIFGNYGNWIVSLSVVVGIESLGIPCSKPTMRSAGDDLMFWKSACNYAWLFLKRLYKLEHRKTEADIFLSAAESYWDHVRRSWHCACTALSSAATNTAAPSAVRVHTHTHTRTHETAASIDLRAWLHTPSVVAPKCNKQDVQSVTLDDDENISTFVTEQSRYCVSLHRFCNCRWVSVRTYLLLTVTKASHSFHNFTFYSPNVQNKRTYWLY